MCVCVLTYIYIYIHIYIYIDVTHESEQSARNASQNVGDVSFCMSREPLSRLWASYRGLNNQNRILGPITLYKNDNKEP